jgi:hypothetical protein
LQNRERRSSLEESLLGNDVHIASAEKESHISYSCTEVNQGWKSYETLHSPHDNPNAVFKQRIFSDVAAENFSNQFRRCY